MATVPDIRLACALLNLDADRTITLPPGTGELRLIRDVWHFADAVHPWLVAPSGCSIPFVGGRVEPERDGRQAMVLRQMPAGTWSYIETRTPLELWSLLTGRIAGLSPGMVFDVRSAAKTRLVIP